MSKQTVLIMEFSEHCNQLIARFVRDEKVYCEIVSPTVELEKLKEKSPIGIIMTGAVKGDYDKLDKDKCKKLGVPVLKLDGHEIDKAELKNFLFEECKADGTWTMAAFAKDAIENLKAQIGDKKVLCALSGGVDSTVVATLIHAACPNLLCVYVDTGLMRKNESEEVVKAFKVERKMNLVKVDAEKRFLAKLKGVTDPEQKRKIIGEEFIRVFEEEAKKIGTVDYLAQGTIYPDLIESGIGAKIVKSHHNVGGLPSVIDFKELVEPVKDLFKDEVRALGFELGLPKELVMRQPFPGPGLGVRVIGEVTKEKLDILREADYIFRSEVAEAGLDTKIWQYFAVMTGLKSVGLRDGGREYEYVIALRAIHSVDAMAAQAVRLPYELLEKVSLRINNEVKGAGRVVYDITNKPPATIEWE